jgi:ABC-type polar amino acid transport system ATPase subunit
MKRTGPVERAPRLEARALAVARGGKEVLANVNLAVREREIHVLEGPSGGGKTTLLRALVMLTTTTAGSVFFEGTDAHHLGARDLRRRAQYVLQESPMLDGSVADNVAIGPLLFGEHISRDATLALLARVGLAPEMAARTASTLSAGEKQRVALARALAHEPAALLLDEPTAALDPDAASRVIQLVRSLAAQGLAIVCVTHIEAHARALAAPFETAPPAPAVATFRHRCEGGRLVPHTPSAA